MQAPAGFIILTYLNEKRDFLKISGIAASALIAGCKAAPADPSAGRVKGALKKGGPLKLSYKPYELQLRHVFTVATNSRTTTPVVLTTIEYDGVAMVRLPCPPTWAKAMNRYLISFQRSTWSSSVTLPDGGYLSYIDGVMPGNHAAKASLDIALHDLTGKLLGQPWFRLWGLNPQKAPVTSFTIGIDTADVVKGKNPGGRCFQAVENQDGQGQ